MKRGTGSVVAAGVGFFFLIVAVATASHAFRFALEDDPQLDGCPKSVSAAKDMASREANRFRKMYASGTWTGFLYVYRRRIRGCPTFIRQAYIRRARSVLAPDAEPAYTRIRSIKTRTREY